MPVVSDYSALLSGFYWYPGPAAQKPVILTYSFVTSAALGAPEIIDNPFVAPIDPERQEWIRGALNSFSNISGIIFIETTLNEGDINFGYYNLDALEKKLGYKPYGFAGYPESGAFFEASGKLRTYGGTGEYGAGIIRIDYKERLSSRESFDHVLTHEIGHALGLKHPFEGEIRLDLLLDNGTNTIMSYKEWQPHIAALDINAIQEIYGDSANDLNYPFAWSWNSISETLSQTTTVESEFIKGTRANDIVILIGGNDDVALFSGDDIVYSNLDYSEINFGLGIDVVIYNNPSTDFLWSVSSSKDTVFINRKGDDINLYETLINVEVVKFTDKIYYFNNYDSSLWKSDSSSMALVASLYQFFLGNIPSEAGFEYLIYSPFNSTDLNDKYYSGFNAENRYINFASNLASSGEGKSFFEKEYGDISFSEVVEKAYKLVSGNTNPTQAALAFFESARGYYESVASARVVSASVDLATGTKIVAIGSIINEVVKFGAGLYPTELSKLLSEVQITGVSSEFGNSMLL